jgi:thiopeptide-type bacteriocin biosynthesis protein
MRARERSADDPLAARYTPVAQRRVWLSAHLHLASPGLYGAAGDRMIAQTVVPIVARLRAPANLRRWFFIRYGEHGPHIRLRMSVRESDIEWVKSTIGEMAGVVRWVAYDAELDRYGGPAAIRVAERVFHASSLFAIAVLPPDDNGRAARLGRGLAAMLATLHVFLGDRARAADFAARYASGYLRMLTARNDASARLEDAFAEASARQAAAIAAQVDAIWAALGTGAAFPALDGYAVRLTRARSALARLVDEGRVALGGVEQPNWTACTQRIVPSYVHMTSNRIGVTVEEEAYLAHLIAGALGQ